MSKKIFFVGNIGHGSTFIDNDYKELKKYFDVRHVPMKLYLGMNILQTFKNILWADTMFCWFASFRAVIPTIFAKILNKKIVVVAGGFDVVNAPEINYGAFARFPDKWVSKFVFKYADIVLPVSKYIEKELLEKMPTVQTHVVYNGVDVNKFYPQGEKVYNTVMTVGEVNWNNLKRKGIEDFVKTAKYLPNVNFLVIGEHKDDSINYLKNIATDNVIFLGHVNDRELLMWYQAAKVYAQLSMHEGFSLSTAEAMLCKCIPVVTNKAALPETVGKHGFYIPYNSPALAAICIKEALKRDKDYRRLFRDRVIRKFSLRKRTEELRRILK